MYCISSYFTVSCSGQPAGCYVQPVLADHANSHRIRAVFHDNHLLRVITVSISPNSHIVLPTLTGQNTNSDLAERLRRIKTASEVFQAYTATVTCHRFTVIRSYQIILSQHMLTLRKGVSVNSAHQPHDNRISCDVLPRTQDTHSILSEQSAFRSVKGPYCPLHTFV